MHFTTILALVAATLIVAAPLPADKREVKELYSPTSNNEVYKPAAFKIILKERDAQAKELYGPASNGELYKPATDSIIL